MSNPGPWSDDEFGDLLRDAAVYYAACVQERGDGAEGMDWRDRASQYLRFERLLAHLQPRPHESLLDVGCGSGELVCFCRDRGWEPSYLGIDVCDEMVAACRGRFGGLSAATTTLAELVRQGRRFDLVVASGTFNVRQSTPEEEWRRFVHRSVAEMFALARRGVAFNIMSSRVDYRHDHLYYAEIGEVARIADACGTTDFVIDHSYPLFEMTVTLLAREANSR